MRIAYADCFSGISGDMFLGALVDAGLALDDLRADLARLDLPDAYELRAREVRKGALRATQVEVVAAGEGHHHRGLADIAALIEGSDLPDSVKAASLAVFRRLAGAEARVHGEPVEAVHFHEVGAVDSIVDVVGAAIGLERLGIEQLYASALPVGGGQVESAHGTLPLPAPATLELLAEAGAPLVPSPARAELVTPTGAALLAALARFEQPEMALRRVGVGAGQRDLPWPNVLRLWVGEAEAGPPAQVALLETNIDDMNPEFYGHVMARLFEAGALDVYLTPITMKKNRPATMLSVIARPADEAALADILLAETSTLGVRARTLRRYEAGRAVQMVSTPYGEVPVKLKLRDGKPVMAAPEYEACSRLAREHNVSLMRVYQAALEAGARLCEE